MLKVVTVGGGTGSFVVLTALKNIPNIKITSVVTSLDDGGVAKKERDEFGILPQSDLRKALIALSDTNEINLIRNLFTYRFHKGLGLQGVTLGNLILTALTDLYKSQTVAIKKAQKLLKVNGAVLPITLSKSHILLTLINNQQVLGESHLDEVFWDGTLKIKDIQLVPKAKIYNPVKKALKEADFIIFPPGDLYGSLIVNFVVEGFTQTLQSSNAKLIYISNLMTKYGQTYNYTLSQHIDDIEKFLKKKLDIIIANSSNSFAPDVLKKI